MISLEEIKKNYSSEVHRFDRYLIREYLQYLILSIMFSHSYSQKLSFLGGTCLRIVHKIDRFSEDLDFDNKNLTYNEFLELSEYIKKELENYGFDVENKVINKQAFHCYIKFPDILQYESLTKHNNEKILIRIDTFDQGIKYSTDSFILDKFDLFKQIKVTPKSVILSQKLWTVTQRNRSKGRDFYDIMFLLQITKPDLDFLEGKFGTRDLDEVKKIVLDHIQGFNFDDLVRDVAPFIVDQARSEKLMYFIDFFTQVDLDN